MEPSILLHKPFENLPHNHNWSYSFINQSYDALAKLDARLPKYFNFFFFFFSPLFFFFLSHLAIFDYPTVIPFVAS